MGFLFSVVGGVVGFGSLFVGFAPVGFEVGGGGLVIVVVDEVGENGVERVGFVGEGDVGAVALAVAGAAVGEEHDGDEVGKVGCDGGVGEEVGDFGGEGEGEVLGSAAEELGVAEGAEGLVVTADDVLDGVLGTVFCLGNLKAALVFAVVADDFEFGGNIKFTLVSNFDARWCGLALVVDGAGLAVVGCGWGFGGHSGLALEVGGDADALDVAGLVDEKGDASVEVVVGEDGPVGSGGGEFGAVVEAEGASCVGDVGEGGVDGLFVGDFVEEVVVVVVLDEVGALGLQGFDDGDAVVEGGDDLVPGGAVVGEPFEAHNVVAVYVELVELVFGEVL